MRSLERVTRSGEMLNEALVMERRGRVLLVDDSEFLLSMAKAALMLDGFDVRGAATLAEFDNAMSSWVPDLILADVNMPDIRGEDLCRRLKMDPATSAIPVVLLSSLPAAELARRARACGADDFMSKVDGFAELSERVAVLCEGAIACAY